MKKKPSIGFLVTMIAIAIATAFALSPVVQSCGQKTFTLQLSKDSLASIKDLGYHDQWDKTNGDGLCALYKEMDSQRLTNDVFRATSLSADGKFDVTVATFGKKSFWGLWQTHGMYNYVVLRAVLVTGERVYKCVPVTCKEPITMIQVEQTAAASASRGP